MTARSCKLAKLHADYDPYDRIAAMTYLQSRAAAGELVTGLIYMDPAPTDMHANLNTVTRRSTGWRKKNSAPAAKAWTPSTPPIAEAEKTPRRAGC